MSEIESRLRRLEAAHAELGRELSDLRAEVAAANRDAPATEAESHAPAPPAVPSAWPAGYEPTPARVERTRVPPRPRPRLTLEDVATPRNLAVAGGVAVTLGVAFLVSYGISRGWITEEMRVVCGGLFSAMLVLAGAHLIERRQLSAPALALAMTGLVGLFLTVLAAAQLYELISDGLGIALATVIGGLATAAALRWGLELTATVAIAGVLIAPALVGAEYERDAGLLLFLAPVFAISMAITTVRGWPFLYGVSFMLMLGSLLAVDPTSEFTAAGALAVAAAGLLVSGAGIIGRSLYDGSQPVWQAPIFGAVAGLCVAIGFAMISEAHAPKGGNADLPGTLASIWLFGSAALIGGAALRLHGVGALETRRAALTVSAAALAWGLGDVLHGPALVVSWTAASTATLLAARHDWERGLGLAFFLLAAAHTVADEIPLDALVEGVPSLGKAWVAALALVVVAASSRIWANEERRRVGLAIAAGLVVYAASVTIVDLSQLDPRARGAEPSALDSEARGQVIVSSLWALCGLALVVGGLRRALPAWRSAGLALLGLAAAKIVLYDLAALSTAARTVSFIVVGLVFLVAAFAYQALAGRPPDDV